MCEFLASKGFQPIRLREPPFRPKMDPCGSVISFSLEMIVRNFNQTHIPECVSTIICKIIDGSGECRESSAGIFAGKVLRAFDGCL